MPGTVHAGARTRDRGSVTTGPRGMAWPAPGGPYRAYDAVRERTTAVLRVNGSLTASAPPLPLGKHAPTSDPRGLLPAGRRPCARVPDASLRDHGLQPVRARLQRRRRRPHADIGIRRVQAACRPGRSRASLLAPANLPRRRRHHHADVTPGTFGSLMITRFSPGIPVDLLADGPAMLTDENQDTS